MNFTYILIFFVLIILVILVYQNYKTDTNYISSRIDGKEYLVQDLPFKNLAADIIAKTKIKLIKVVNKLKDKYPDDERVKRINENFNPDNIVETDPNSEYTSYSLNKGEKISLCLRTKDADRRIVKENVIMFVALHELAHIMTVSQGHTQEFWDNFEFLLKEAIKHGYYKNIDFKNDPHEYCGMSITDTPYNPN